jgi:hypothetical protein
MNAHAPMLRSAATALAFAVPVAAQCANVFQPIPASTFVDRAFAAAAWDPDGAGPLPAGVVVGGNFTSIGGQPFQKVALYQPDSGTWTALPGLSVGNVRALGVLPDGTLVAGGTSSPGLARWTGTTWATIGGGVGGGVYSLLVEPNGDLVVGGVFQGAGTTTANGIARWDGTAWTTLPGLQSGGLGLLVNALARTSNGDVYAAGIFALPGGWNVARWNGSAWTPVFTGPSSAPIGTSLLAMPNGDVMVGLGSAVSVWNGTSLQPVASTNGSIFAMRLLPDGDVLVGGSFTQVNLQPFGLVARWNGTSWAPVAGGAGGASDLVLTTAPLPNGDLFVAGTTFQALSSTCPATVASYGVGCAGSGGPNELAATALPWLGSTFRARATGMPGSALVLSVYGFTQLAIPLPTLLPAALPGCTALTSADHLEVQLPSGGTVDTALAIPDAMALVGVAFHHYVVPFELGPAMQLLAVTNSNALTCTLGAF